MLYDVYECVYMKKREGMIVFVINSDSDSGNSNTKLSDIYLTIIYQDLITYSMSTHVNKYSCIYLVDNMHTHIHQPSIQAILHTLHYTPLSLTHRCDPGHAMYSHSLRSTRRHRTSSSYRGSVGSARTGLGNKMVVGEEVLVEGCAFTLPVVLSQEAGLYMRVK